MTSKTPQCRGSRKATSSIDKPVEVKLSLIDLEARTRVTGGNMDLGIVEQFRIFVNGIEYHEPERLSERASTRGCDSLNPSNNVKKKLGNLPKGGRFQRSTGKAIKKVIK